MKFRQYAVAVLCALACTLPARALPLHEIRLDDLLAQAPELKKSLALTANQALLWQQLEPKIRQVIRTRQLRREKLQSELRQALDKPATELRELAPKLNAESDIALPEDKQLQEYFLTLNDALDDNQRQMVLHFWSDQLQRQAAGEREGRRDKAEEKGQRSGEHGRGRRPGGGAP
jgi:hypothetical protein